jgi:hypothetical protein
VSGEDAAATVKETWGTYNAFAATAAVPLVAAGLVKGLGNGSIVAAPNAGGYGIPGSIWSAYDVNVDGSGGGGIGSVTTCHLGDYLGSVPVSELETTCAGSGNTGCTCANVAQGSPDMLSGHYGGTYKQEGPDVLDIDGNHGSAYDSATGNVATVVQPDIQFFPGANAAGTCLDNATDATDDNLFEWIFNTDVNSAKVCSVAADLAAEDAWLDGAGGTKLTGGCSALSSSSNGLYYMANDDTTACTLNSDVGSPDSPVVAVVNGPVTFTGGNFFGMLFIRWTQGGPAPDPLLQIAGNGNVFGSVVVDGKVDGNGTFTIVYVDTSSGTPGSKLPATTRFARLPGSWLDNSTGF